jgi:uncharacterized protein YjiK
VRHCVTGAATVLALCARGAAWPLTAQTPGALARYDFAASPAARWKLPRALDEISGLTRDSAGRLFAHADERAIVYQIDPVSQRIVKQFTFGQPAIPGDFEAIAIVGNRVMLTTSDGLVYVGHEGRDGEAVRFTRYATGIGRFCEVEGLAWDARARELLFACKTPRVAPLRGQLAVFGWSPERPAPVTAPRVRVPLATLAPRIGRTGVAPSELVIDPKTGHLLLLAARAHAIIELTPTGELVDVARLRASLHRQAEGLAFGSDGTLLVADEANGGRATLTSYAAAP